MQEQTQKNRNETLKDIAYLKIKQFCTKVEVEETPAWRSWTATTPAWFFWTVRPFFRPYRTLIFIKAIFYHFKSGIYIKIKHFYGIKEGQRVPKWFFYTIRFLFLPYWTIQNIRDNDVS